MCSGSILLALKFREGSWKLPLLCIIDAFGLAVKLREVQRLLTFFAVFLYGIGTALPVGVISLIAVFSAEKAGRFLECVQQLQVGALTLTSWVLIVIGIWLTLTNTLQIL